ncbi:MAG: sulfite exporter TauE/SafE family protein [Pseudolabrys sp.]|nr:sulfite exporter TauE/SafE family protein [Pseudolabrys sp.]MDP2298275.1 sulfite exporter TauE/SafE family protein [Pseudolabrys sp.]
MFSLPLWSVFADAAADPRFPWALGIATVAGLVRGFSGFGSALIYMPLISAIYAPAVAAPTILLIDTLCGLPFAIHAWPQANRREVLPVSIGGAVGVPVGVLALLYVDPLSLRWFIAVLVLVAVAALAAGWRYHGKPTLPASLGVGATSGFGAGAVQIGAPPLLVFWLGGNNSATTVRANIMVYFILQGTLSFALYLTSGLFDAQIVVLSLLFGAPFALAMFAGAYWFHGSSDAVYRRVAYVIIGFAGLASLPIFDGLR